MDRRHFLKMAAASSALPLWQQAVANEAAKSDRILVTLELSGGNDGLNSIVPFGDDAYYRHRPTLGLKQQQCLELDDFYGFNPGMLGFQRLWQRGELAIFHGCGYDNPSYSHFTSMAYMHTAAPNSGAADGWYGRLADTIDPQATPAFLINVDATQSLAVNSRKHTPVVFDDPNNFQRRRFGQTPQLSVAGKADSGNSTLDFLRGTARSGADAAESIRSACARYQSPVDYGIVPLDLDKIAACIAADLPARLYYTSFRNNAFDTHVQQGPLHKRLIAYACDAVHGFLSDMRRLGLEDRVLVLVFSEFGRRLGENTNQGTDHGTANVMFLAGAPVKGGHYGQHPDLNALRADDNLHPTTDFREVYATAVEWLAPGASKATLGGDFRSHPATRANS